ncbi:hypothetical protein [Faecalibaculum rodentium]|uniref:hypothetical protein n=1 Tax=Faecalibaculum rodentium TaxID=1702221 RepID=UPI0023F440EF|nr:hypothetical protein [Faecalibaculum rodentium]
MTNNRNGLFLISAGCLFILLSFMMPQPIYLIFSGLALTGIGLWMICRSRRQAGSRKESR